MSESQASLDAFGDGDDADAEPLGDHVREIAEALEDAEAELTGGETTLTADDLEAMPAESRFVALMGWISSIPDAQRKAPPNVEHDHAVDRHGFD